MDKKNLHKNIPLKLMGFHRMIRLDLRKIILYHRQNSQQITNFINVVTKIFHDFTKNVSLFNKINYKNSQVNLKTFTVKN